MQKITPSLWFDGQASSRSRFLRFRFQKLQNRQKDLLSRGLAWGRNVSGRRKPAIYERLKTSHPEKERVCRVGSPDLDSGGGPAWRTSSRWRIFKRS